MSRNLYYTFVYAFRSIGLDVPSRLALREYSAKFLREYQEVATLRMKSTLAAPSGLGGGERDQIGQKK